LRSSSVEWNPPLFWRYSTMRAARAGPTPGRTVSCSTVAVFRSTLVVAADESAPRARPVVRKAAMAKASPVATMRRSFMSTSLTK
jgi:hypothetical protein